MRLERLVQRIQDALSPDLIDKHWQTQDKENSLHGYCYISSEALYYLWGKAHGFKPAQMWVHVGRGKSYSHWFLRNDEVVLDITAVQFGGTRIAYRKAKDAKWITRSPSNAALEIIRRIGYDPEVLADYL